MMKMADNPSRKKMNSNIGTRDLSANQLIEETD
jgi:hypothetical protein